LIGDVIGQDLGKDDLFVMHPAQLKGDLEDEDYRRPNRKELQEQAANRDFFGKIERMPHIPIGTAATSRRASAIMLKEAPRWSSTNPAAELPTRIRIVEPKSDTIDPALRGKSGMA